MATASIRAFHRVYPRLAEIPIKLVGDRAVSVKEVAQENLQFSVEEEKSIVDENYLWFLAVAYYSNRSAEFKEDVRLALFGMPLLTLTEALKHVIARDEIGFKLVRMYAGLRQEALRKIAQL
jgi:hypothetical protein